MIKNNDFTFISTDFSLLICLCITSNDVCAKRTSLCNIGAVGELAVQCELSLFMGVDINMRGNEFLFSVNCVEISCKSSSVQVKKVYGTLKIPS